MNHTGLVQSAYVRDNGAALVTDALVGDTVLFVEFAADFDEDGGTLSLNGDEYGYTLVDKEADTVTLGSALTVAAGAGDMVTVVGSTGDPIETWYAEVLLDDPDDSDPVDCEIESALVDKFDEGVYEPPLPIEVTVEDGSWAVVKAPGRVLPNTSRDYVPGETGWALGSDDAQLPNTNVAGSLGADSLSADTLVVAGQDFQTDVLANIPSGLTAYANIATGTPSAAINTPETVTFEFNAGTLLAGHAYVILCHGHFVGSVAGDAFDLRLRYTTNNTVPTITSPTIDGSLTRVNTPTIVSTGFSMTGFYFDAVNDAAPLRMSLTILRAGGTGTGAIYQSSVDRSLQFFVLDMGYRDAITGAFVQRSKSTGTPDIVDPVTTYTKTFTATTSRSYDADNGFRTGDPATHDCYQGYYSGTHGNTKSLIGFDAVAIQNALTGATVKSVKLKFRVKHSYYNSGLNVHIKTHNNATLPSTYSAGGEIASRDGCREGSTYTVTLPVSFGTDLKAGTARGVGFYGPSTSRAYYGYMYGPTSGSAPQLIITYTK